MSSCFPNVHHCCGPCRWSGGFAPSTLAALLTAHRAPSVGRIVRITALRACTGHKDTRCSKCGLRSQDFLSGRPAQAVIVRLDVLSTKLPSRFPHEAGMMRAVCVCVNRFTLTCVAVLTCPTWQQLRESSHVRGRARHMYNWLRAGHRNSA